MRGGFFVALLILMAASAGPVLAVVSRPHKPQELALVILPPWQDRQALLTALEGQIIGPIQAPMAIFVDATAMTADVARVHGAWAVIAASTLAEICGKAG